MSCLRPWFKRSYNVLAAPCSTGVEGWLLEGVRALPPLPSPQAIASKHTPVMAASAALDVAAQGSTMLQLTMMESAKLTPPAGPAACCLPAPAERT